MFNLLSHGQETLTDSYQEVSIDNFGALTPGLYWYQIQTGTGSVSGKLIKQ